MTTLNLKLTEALQEFVEEQAANGGYASPSDYVKSVLRDEQKRQAEVELEAKLLEGLKSGPATEMIEADWQAIRQEVRASCTQRKTG